MSAYWQKKQPTSIKKQHLCSEIRKSVLNLFCSWQQVCASNPSHHVHATHRDSAIKQNGNERSKNRPLYIRLPRVRGTSITTHCIIAALVSIAVVYRWPTFSLIVAYNKRGGTRKPQLQFIVPYLCCLQLLSCICTSLWPHSAPIVIVFNRRQFIVP